MAVAIQNSAETKAGAPPTSLGVVSLLGAAYVFLAFVVVYHLVPQFWEQYVHVGANPFVGFSLLFLVQVAAVAGAVFLWSRMSLSRPGLRGGMFLVAAYLGVGVLLAYWLALFCEWLLPKFGLGTAVQVVGLIVVGSFAFLWLRFVWRRLAAPAFERTSVRFEEQGWFTVRPYKRGQGLKTRRGTMLGVLLLVGAGLWGYYQRTGLRLGQTWTIDLPFTANYMVPLLRSYGISILVVSAALTLWFAYRLVNYPRFADFLIATEAEMNKVYWTSRSRLYQDTIVVLVFMALLALILMIMDYFWTFILVNLIGVIQ